MNFTNNGKPLDPIAFVSEHTSRELVARGIALEKAPVTNNIKVSISKIGIQNHRANGFSPMVTLTSLVADVDTPSGRKRMSVLIKRGKVPVWSFDELNSPCYDEPMNLLTKELAAKINRDVFGLRIDDAEVDRLLAKIKAEAATNPMAYFDVYQLGFGNNPRAIDGLVQLTASEHEYVRLAAISSLGIIKARSQQARLESLYRGIGADLWQDRAIALKAIGDLDSNESRAFLQAELERLEARNRSAEGIAAHRIFAGLVQCLLGTADLFEGIEHGGTAENLIEQSGTSTLLTQQGGRSVVEDQVGLRAGGVEGLQRGAFYRRIGQIDQAEAGTLATLGDDDGEVGDVTVDHRDLCTAELAIAVADAVAGRIGVARTLRHREGADQFASRQLGQVVLLLSLGTGQQQRLGGDIDRRGEGDRCQRPADLLGDDAEFEMAEPQTAELLGNGGRGPAHRSDLVPQIAVERLIRFENLAHITQCAAVGQKLVGLLLEQLLVVGKFEIHAENSCADGKGKCRQHHVPSSAMHTIAGVVTKFAR